MHLPLHTHTIFVIIIIITIGTWQVINSYTTTATPEWRRERERNPRIRSELIEMGWKNGNNNNNNNNFDVRKKKDVAHAQTPEPTYVAMNAHKTYVSAARATNYPSFEAFISWQWAEADIFINSCTWIYSIQQHPRANTGAPIPWTENKPLNCLSFSCMVRFVCTRSMCSRDGIALLMHFNIRVCVLFSRLLAFASVDCYWVSMQIHTHTIK